MKDMEKLRIPKQTLMQNEKKSSMPDGILLLNLSTIPYSLSQPVHIPSTILSLWHHLFSPVEIFHHLDSMTSMISIDLYVAWRLLSPVLDHHLGSGMMI